MDSLSNLLGKLRLNDPYFREKFIDITSVYCAPFDSDTVLQYLKEDVLFTDDAEHWVVCIMDDERVMFSPDIISPFPETIEEFRAMAKSHGLNIALNTQTATKIYG